MVRPAEEDRIYITQKRREIPGIGRGDGTIEEVWIDGVGKHHRTGVVRRIGRSPVIKACMWRHIKEWQPEWGQQEVEMDQRWIGPETTAFPGKLKWKIGGEVEEIGALSIKKITQARTDRRMKPPQAQDAWNSRIGRVKWKKVWRIRSFFTTPRDQSTWLKLAHRNLYVANRDSNLADRTCRAHRCNADESMLHLVECHTIKTDFWDKIASLQKNSVYPEEQALAFG